jgi:phosphoribosylanthranilate isomerase
MSIIRIKICGITRAEDAISASEEGADAIGLVFYPASKRAVNIKSATAIIQVLPPFITKVGLFVNASAETVKSVLKEVNLDLLQFHGEEAQEDCLLYNKPFIKAVKVKEGIDIYNQSRIYDKSLGILLDSFVPGVPGGTGETFNWKLVPDNIEKPIILAGGLNPENVCYAIDRIRPYAVDVSGGVESEPGIKDRIKMKNFIKSVRDSS